MNIYIDESGITSISNNIQNDIDSFNSQIKMLNSVIDDINEAWQGGDALKYINVMRDKYIIALYDLHDLLEEYASYLNKVPGAYSTLDEAFKGKNLEV